MAQFLLVVLLVSVSCLGSESYSATYKPGRCTQTNDVTGECVERELLPANGSQNVVNDCVQLGGSYDPFGTCLVKPEKMNQLLEQAKLPDGNDFYQGLLANVKKCEEVARSAVGVCTRSYPMLKNARASMNRFNDVISVQSSMSPADACVGMQDAVSASRVQLKAWQQTCGEALSACQHSCESTLVAVKSSDELAQMTKKAIQQCTAFYGQRDDVTRSVAMASSAVESSRLCQQQIGGDQAPRDRKQNTARASDSLALPESPTISPFKNLDSNYSAPTVLGAETVQQAANNYRPQAAVRLQGTDERDVQGARRRPATTPTKQQPEANGLKKTQPQQERQGATGSPVRFPTGVARATLDGSNRAGNNSKGWPIPTGSAAQQASIQTFAPTGAISGAVQKGFQAVNEVRKVVKPSFGPITREPSNLETISYREIGIAGRGADMFRNIHIQFLRLSETLSDL